MKSLIIFVALTLPALAADFKGTCDKPVSCNAATVTTTSDGRTTVSFSNGLGFTGTRMADGQSPLFFTDIMTNDGTQIPIAPGSGQGCHFYFTDHGTFTKGWESRLTIIECDVRLGNKHPVIKFTAQQP